MRQAQTFTDATAPREDPARAGVVVHARGGFARVQMPSGQIIPRMRVVGGASVGASVRVFHEDGEYVAYASGDSAGAGGVTATGGSGGMVAHDFLGTTYHTLPTVTAGYVLAGPAGASGVPSFRAVALTDINAALGGRSVLAGAGLTGGGALNADISLAVGAGAGISVAADTVGVNQAYAFSWSAAHTFGAGLSVSGANTITLGGDVTMSRSAADLLAFGSNDSLGTSSFVSGFSGSGWRVNYSGGFYGAEFDNLVVRGSMRVYELIIQKIRSGNGSYLFSPGGRVKSVSGGPTYTLTFDTDHGLASNGTTQKDLVRAQKFDLGMGGVYVSVLQIESIIDTVTLTATVISGAAPQAAYEYVRFGNTGDTNRQGGVYITADDTNAPYLDVFDGVASLADWGSTTKTKLRLGKLNGAYGVVGNYYGVGLGDYSSGNYLRYNNDTGSGGGFVIRSGSNGVSIGNLNGVYGVATNLYGVGIGDYAGGNYLKYDTTNGFTIRAGGENVIIGNSGVAIIQPEGSSSVATNTYQFYSQTHDADSVGLSSWYNTAGSGTSVLLLSNTPLLTAPAGPVATTLIRAEGTSGSTVVVSVGAIGSTLTTTTFSVSGIATTGDNIYLGTAADVRLYRSAANMLRTPDGLTVDAGLNLGSATSAAAGYLKLSGFIQSSSGALVLNPAAGASVDIYTTSSGQGFRVMDTSYSSVMAQALNTGDGYFAGKLGIGTASPQAKLHTYDTDGGTLHNWRTTGIAGTRVTIVANGTGDCTQSCSVFGTAYDSSGNSWELRGTLESGVSAGSEQTVQVAGDATDNLHVKVKTDGQIEIVRNAGARTWSVCISAWWR